MRKYRHLLIFFLFGWQNITAQQDIYQWRIGIQSGLGQYYGDLNTRFFAPSPLLRQRDWNYLAYGASLEKFLSESWSVKLNYWQGKLISNDIYTNSNQEIVREKSNFARALNAQTHLQALNFQFTYYLDNGKWRSSRAFISPYFTAGLGLLDFKVYGDLLNQAGTRYYYWSDQTIRNLAEGNPAAQIISQDGVFETNLSDLQTEGKAYNTRVWQIPLGIGFKFRLSNRLNLNLEMLANYTFTDYLDDVSGNYLTQFNSEIQQIAANPTNTSQAARGRENDRWNDIYAITSVSLHYNFGAKKTNFKAPPIFAANTAYTGKEFLIEQKTDTLNSVMLAKDSLTGVKRDTFRINPLNPHLVHTQPISQNLHIVQDSSRRQIIHSHDTLVIRKSQAFYFQPIDTLVQFSAIDKNSNLITPPLAEREAYDLVINDSLEAQKIGQDIAYLEAQIKKQKLENELLALQNNPRENTRNGVANSLIVNDLYTKKDSIIANTPSSQPLKLTEAQNYILQERLRLEKEKQAFYLEQLSVLKRSNEANQNRLNYANNLPITNQPNNSNPSLSPQTELAKPDSLSAAQKIKVDSANIRRQISQNLAKDSLAPTHPAWESINQKIDQLALQMAIERQTQTNAQNNQQLLNEIQILKNQVVSLQSQLSTPPTEKAKTPQILGNYQVYFASGVMDVDAPQRTQLANIVRQMRQNAAEPRFVLQGYSDKFGNPSQNMSLSKLRAEKVRDLLLAFGVPWSAIQVEYYGANHAGTPGNPALDRRVEIQISQ